MTLAWRSNRWEIRKITLAGESVPKYFLDKRIKKKDGTIILDGYRVFNNYEACISLAHELDMEDYAAGFSLSEPFKE